MCMEPLTFWINEEKKEKHAFILHLLKLPLPEYKQIDSFDNNRTF